MTSQVVGADQWQYLGLLGLCVIGTLPLEVIGGARVYRRPRALLATLVPVVVLFGGWDLLAVHHGEWSYSARYTLGVWLAGLPVEEWLFFVVVPTCAVLTFEVLGRGGRGDERELYDGGRWRAGRGRAGRGGGAADRDSAAGAVLGHDRDHAGVPGAGRRVADQAERTDRPVPGSGLLGRAVAVGHSGRGLRIRGGDDHADADALDEYPGFSEFSGFLRFSGFSVTGVRGVRGVAALGALRLTVRGGLAGIWVRGRIPAGPVVLAANHHSWWDPFIAVELAARARRRATLVVDPGSLRRYRFARGLGAIGTDEPRAGLAALRAGAVLVIYPEARMLPAGPPGPLAAGASWYARRGTARLCSAAVRVMLRGGQFGEAYVVLSEVEVSGTGEAVTGRLHDQLRRDVAELDRLNTVADPREPLPGLRCAVRARRGWDERVDAVRSWARS